MNKQRDAILGYAQDLHTYYIQFIENNAVLGQCYGLLCMDEKQAENIVTTLVLKKSFWLSGVAFQDAVSGLKPISTNFCQAS